MPSRGAKALTLLIGLGLTLQTAALAARFVDTSQSWTERYINRLSDKGVIAAEPDGKFNPEKPVTRAQFAAWLVNVLSLEGQATPSASSYPDVKPTDWYFKSVEIARQNNIMSGYADGFRPNSNIQRAEMMALIARLLRSSTPDQAQTTEQLAKFKDGDKVPEWAKAAVVQDVLAGVFVNEASPDRLNPTDDATRGDVAALLSKLDEYLSKQSIDAALNTPTAPIQQQAYAAPVTQVVNPNGPQPGYPGGQYRPGNYQQSQQQPYGQSLLPGQVTKSQPDYSPNYSSAQPPPYSGYGAAAPPLQGGVAEVAAGTKFRAQLKTSIDSGTARSGEQVEATIGDPIYVNGNPVVPAGSRLVGTITDAVSAKRFRAGANGKIEFRFTSIETPDGRRFPLSASVDGIRLSGGSAAGRVGKGVAATAIGAGSGALLGTAIGAIVGGAGGGRNVGQAIGVGALVGTAIGGGVGVVGGVVRKGSEIKLNAGMSLPLKLDQTLQVTNAPAQQGYPAQQYGYGAGAPQYNYQPPQ